VVLVHLDEDPRHRTRLLAQLLDVVICHRFRLLAEQLAASRDRMSVPPSTPSLDAAIT
jgi:hypothetical protein